MKYAATFSFLGLYLLGAGVYLGDGYLLLLWPALSFLLVGLAYCGLGPRVFGKRPDGRLSWWSALLLFPFLLLAWSSWHLYRFVSREGSGHEVAPGLWVGRRPFLHELPPGTALVVDLTSEFSCARGVGRACAYRCLPTLDTRAPGVAAFDELVAEVAGWQGTVYVHCAQGRGRSALFAAAVVLARGLAGTPDEAVALLRQARPAIGLTHSQNRLLARWWAERATTSTPRRERRP